MHRWFPIHRLRHGCLLFLFILGTALPVHGATPSLGAIATQHPLATEAAARVLREGGNAIDAAVAAALTLAVVEPYNSGLGGGGMAMIWIANEKKPHAVDFRETAPAGLRPEFFQNGEAESDAARAGPWAIAVPGELKGLAEMQHRYGKLPWKRLFDEAIRYAENGSPDPYLRERALEKKDCLQRDFDSAQVYQALLSEQNPSDLLYQSDLARSLKIIRDKGAEVFYQGELGERLVKALASKGAPISVSDLHRYRVIEREPLVGHFSWGNVWGMPPPSSGGVSVLLGLKLYEEFKKKQGKDFADHWSNLWLSTLAYIFGLRNSAMGDPDFVAAMPVHLWLSGTQIHKIAELILKDPASFISPKMAVDSKSAGHTTHLSIIDQEGNAVSMTLTLNLPFGSCLTAGDTGIMMNDEIDDFTIQASAPNAFGLVQSSLNKIEPGKRPLSSLSPTLVSDMHGIRLALGSPGGPKIITSVLLTLIRHYLLGESLAEAVAAPRIHFQGEPFKVSVEKGNEEKNLNFSIPVEVLSPFGNVQAVSRDPQKKSYEAVSDPRGKGKSTVVDSGKPGIPQ